MYLRDLKGLKFPDNAVIKWFFKSGFANEGEGKKVLELACSNGNNLSLFASYNYECLGVDFSKQNIENANFNFSEIIGAKNYKFFAADMFDFVSENKGLEADILMIPNVINYFSRQDFVRLLKLVKENEIYKNGADFFLRTRSVKDYRYGLGKKIAYNSFALGEIETTGEKGCINTLYQEHELVFLLKEHLKLSNFKVLHYESQNIMGADEQIVNDCDIVIYGKIK